MQKENLALEILKNLEQSTERGLSSEWGFPMLNHQSNFYPITEQIANLSLNKVNLPDPILGESNLNKILPDHYTLTFENTDKDIPIVFEDAG